MIYVYTCIHENCKQVVKGIRKCRDCGMIIITDYDMHEHENNEYKVQQIRGNEI